MKRLQVQFTEEDYQIIRKIGFLENKPISEIIRSATKLYISSKKDINKELENVFASDDEVNLAIEESIKDFSDVYEKLAK